MTRPLYKPILLNIEADLLDKIDAAVREFYVTRSNFLRESAKRNLRYYQNHERPTALRLKTEAYK
jgi:metal-responsive CopG/Arc/MetJ family transcriptional regulator